jgi:hypothetical protein
MTTSFPRAATRHGLTPRRIRHAPASGVWAALLAFTVAACASSSAPARTTTPQAAASGAAAASAPAASAAPVASAAPATSGVVDALVTALHADPFKAHIDESIVASSLTGATKVQVTANALGDISGRDVSIHITGTGSGPPADQEIVSVGEDAWIRAKGAPTWDLRPRTDVAPSLDGLLQTIRLIKDPAQLVDTGIETLDGTALHHLIAPMAVAYESANGIHGTYDSFDIWTTDTGVPVVVKATFSAAQDTSSITGSTEIHYSQVGGPITIRPPAGAPTLAP